jgi:hypothetical protein
MLSRVRATRLALVIAALLRSASTHAQSAGSSPSPSPNLTRAIAAVGGTLLIARTLRDEIAMRAPGTADSARIAFDRWLIQHALPVDAESHVGNALGRSAWDRMQREFDVRLAPRVRRTVPPRVTAGTLRDILSRRDFDLASQFGPELRTLREANVWTNGEVMSSTTGDSGRASRDSAVVPPRTGAARPPSRNPGRAHGATSMAMAAPGRGIPDSLVAGLYWKDATRTICGINGIEVSIDSDLVLALTDGTAYRDPKLAPAAIDIAQSRRVEPERWGRWTRRGADVYVRWPDGDEEVRAGAPKTSLSERGPLDGAFSRTTGGGNTMVGGSVAGVRTRGTRFSRDGRFVGSMSTSMGAGNAAGGAARRDEGTYTLTSFGVRLRYADGREEFPVAYVYTADRDTGRIKSIMLGAALLMAP